MPTSSPSRACSLLLAVALPALGMGLGAIAGSRAAELTPRDPQQLAERIDGLLAEKFQAAGVAAAPAADDAEFLRRLTLDLLGRIPTVAEVRAFLADDTADKRARAVDRLLDDPAHVRHFSHVWRSLLLAQADAQALRYLTPKIERWLERQLRDDVPYDAWVRKLVTAPLDGRPAGLLDDDEDLDAYATAFLQANELKPENLAAATARMFLGVNLDCAQCHDHPFADWKQDQFWQLAVFYGGVGRLRPDNPYLAAPEAFDRRELSIPGTERTVRAAFLDGGTPRWTAAARPRSVLADWLTAPDNPYFARSAVNRLWAHLFGRGLVDPLDDLGGRKPPSHPQLLDELARQFVAHQYDVKYLLRALARSAAYGRTSRASGAGDAPHFSRMRVRGLSAEQVGDSLATAVGERRTGAANPAHAALLARFASLDRPTETQTSITQALSLMNGPYTAAAVDPLTSPTLQAVINAPFLDLDARIETLVLATLSRRPVPEEARRFRAFVMAAADRDQGLADLFWALLNSGEFVLNR